MDSDYGQRYRELYDRHWWWRAREAVVLGELARLRPPDGWKRALDVGCGDGLLFARLGDYAAHVEGLEPDSALVSEARAEGNRIHLRPFDLSFRPEHRYDLILFLDVLEHIEDAQGAVAHAATLLEPGGVVLVTVPAFRHLWTCHDDLNHHWTRYTKAELTQLLSQHLKVVEARYFFRWVYPAKLIQRAAETIRRPGKALPTLPHPAINAALYAISRLDEVALGWSHIPLGSSIFAAGRKA